LEEGKGDVLCLNDDDLPVKFTFSNTELVASKVETEVDDDAFAPPAKVQEGTTPTTAATPSTTAG
ncbi:MAG: hypothetical protein ACRD0S_12785, partial [Acidimicrobiales bacterium]